jgi:carbon starvation protein CstA
MTSTSERRHVTAGSSSPVLSIYSALIGVSAFAILLQGVWAGLFIGHQGEGWVEVHAVGGEVAIAFAAVASILVIWKLRSRRDLLVGTLLVTLLLVVEAYLGGLIVDEHKDALTVVHIPLAMALISLAVWLPLRANRRP